MRNEDKGKTGREVLRDLLSEIERLETAERLLREIYHDLHWGDRCLKMETKLKLITFLGIDDSE